MPYVIKTEPFDAISGNNVSVSEKTMYGGDKIRPGDEAFVWFSETSGGSGLVWQAHVASVDGSDGPAIGVNLRLTNGVPGRALGKDELEPLREVRDGTPISEMARKLYYQAHNKIAAINHADADWLRQFFDPGSDWDILVERSI